MSRAIVTATSELFGLLAEAMRIPVGQDVPSQKTRIEWVRNGAIKPEASPYQRAGEKTIGRLASPWLATIYAPTDDECQRLLGELWGHLDRLLGPPQGGPAVGEPDEDDYIPESPGYRFEPGTIAPQGGDGKAAGYACDVAVTLYQAVAGIIYPDGPPAAAMSLEVEATSDIADADTEPTAAGTVTVEA